MAKEIATRTDTALVPANAEEFVSWLSAIPENESEASDAAALRILDMILQAPDVETLFEASEGSLPSSKSLVGAAIQITDVQSLNPSRFQGLPAYAVVEGTFLEGWRDEQPGDSITFSAGGRTLLAMLYKFISLDALPIDVRIKAKPTNAGYDVILFTPVDGEAKLV